MRLAAVLTVFVIATVVAAPVQSYALSQTRPVGVSSGPDGAAWIKLGGGRTIMVPKEVGQVRVSEGRIAPDGTVGWFAEFLVDGVAYPVAQTLVLWRAGTVIRRFETGRSFYSWTFYADGTQIAYHDGPLHGERASHCELHDLAGGRTIAVWDGDLQSHTARPIWTQGLTR